MEPEVVILIQGLMAVSGNRTRAAELFCGSRLPVSLPRYLTRPTAPGFCWGLCGVTSVDSPTLGVGPRPHQGL